MHRLFVAVALVLFSLPVVAQKLPNHIDPSARENAPDLSMVPAIRFLTSIDFPPFNYRDEGGRLIGFHIDLSKAICAEIDVSCTIQAWPWEQAASALADNQGDVLLAGLSIDAATAEQFDFSSIYLMLPGRFVAPKIDSEAFDVANLQGKKVGVRASSAHSKFLSAYLPEITQIDFETEIEALTAMRDGETDLYFGDAMRASFWLNENDVCCTFAGQAYFNPNFFGAGLAAAIPAGRGSVREAVDFALVRLQKNGKLDELYLRWFPVSFY